MVTLCHRCGRPEPKRSINICLDCGAALPPNPPLVNVAVLKLFAWCCAIVAVLFALLALNGCGAPFTADYFSTAGAGGYIQTMSQAGAGGREVVPNGNAGQGQNAGSAGAVSSGGADAAGGSGSAAGIGGRGMVAGAGSAGAGGDAAAACLTDWEGSSCDTCTSSASSQGARSCLAVLDCYTMNHCTPATCAGLCDYAGPTSDAAVRAAHAVFECRCVR
ncbi:MAG TPA: hypothetical protein VNM39_13250 [Verrucomicrobiae bacterium]|nr:hypothetical protein [Verrucomicrobiae bacterium]